MVPQHPFRRATAIADYGRSQGLPFLLGASAGGGRGGADSEWIIWFDTGRMHSAGDWGEFTYDHLRAVRDAP